METLYAMCGDVAHKIAAHGDPAPDIPKASFYGFGPMADINESGVFVYQAELEGIDGVGYEEPAALYWGTLDDPRQLIVKTGDVLNGYTVQNISFKPFINDDGVISFKTESDIRLQPEKYDYTDYVHQVHRYDTTTGTLETLISIGDAVDGEIIYELSDGPIDEDGNVLVKAEELDGIYENDAILLVSAPGTWDVITRTGMVGPSKRPYTHVGQPTFNTAGVVLYTAEECLDGSTSCYGTDEITHLTRRLPDDSHEVLLTTRSAMGSVGTTPAYVEGFTHLQASVGEAGYQAWKIDLTDSADDYGTELGYALLLYDGTDLDEVARTPLVVGKDTLYDFSYVHAGSDGTVFFHAQYEEDGETNGLYCWDEAGGVREVARDGGTVDSTTIEWLHASAIAFDRQIRADGTILTVAELDGYTDWYSFYDEEPPEQLIVLECPDAS